MTRFSVALAAGAMLLPASASAQYIGGRPPEPPPACPVRLRTLSHYSGVPAAGFVEISSGRTFLLREGETLGPYRLLAAAVALGEAVLLSGTNSFTVPLTYAAGQATNIVPSAREPYPTVFRADTPTGAAVAAVEEPAAADVDVRPSASGVQRSEKAPKAVASQKRRAVSATLTPEEEADLVRRATVRGEDGAEHVSFRELQRLRAGLLAERAAAARAAALAEEEERRAEAAAKRAAENAAKKAAEDEAKAMGDEYVSVEHIFLSMLRQGVCLLPCIWLLPFIGVHTGLFSAELGVWLALPVSDVLCQLATVPPFFAHLRFLGKRR